MAKRFRAQEAKSPRGSEPTGLKAQEAQRPRDSKAKMLIKPQNSQASSKTQRPQGSNKLIIKGRNAQGQRSQGGRLKVPKAQG